MGAELAARQKVVAPALHNVLWAPLCRLMPHRRVVGVWRERPLDVILRGDTHLPVDGGVAAGWAWHFLVREWTRLRRSSRLLRAVSVALILLVLTVR